MDNYVNYVLFYLLKTSNLSVVSTKEVSSVIRVFPNLVIFS
jgi:hypothetical protein